jgi:hypothetical protein
VRGDVAMADAGLNDSHQDSHQGSTYRRIERKRESNSTFRDAGVTAMLGSMIEMGGRGDGRGVVRGS